MKLTIFFILLGIFQVTASVYSQNGVLTFKDKSMTMREVFKEVETQSQFRFFYNDILTNIDKTVTMSTEKMKIDEVLSSLLSNTDLSYKILENNLIIISPKSLLEQPQKKITGTVTDETTGNSIPGVSVKVEGTTKGTLTGVDGKYTLNVDPNAVLLFSFVGYLPERVTISGKSVIDVKMKTDVKNLDEVIVVGYGTQKKVNLLGAVSQVTFDKIESRPISNVGQALQGQIPNLNVKIADGSPNTVPQINVRGGTSFSGGSLVTGSPLILVDGIEMDINQLNPADIASISVLKDASSAAIYGSRAAFGVMLVTTKSGKKNEKARISYDNSFQWNSPNEIPNLLDNYTIQNAYNKSLAFSNQTVPTDQVTRLTMIQAYNADPKNVAPYYMVGNSINWIANNDIYGMALLQNSPMQKHNINVSGGNDKSAYYASFGVQNQDGLYKINTDKYKRYNAMLKASTEISKWLSVDLKSSYNYSTYSQPVSPSGKGGWWTAMSQEPTRNINMPMKTPATSPVGVMYTDNILSFMDYGSSDLQSKENIILGVSPTITPLKGWRIKGDFSFRTENNNQKTVIPELNRIDASWTSTTNVYTSPSSVEVIKNHANQYTINAYTDYTIVLKKHEFTALAGYNQEWYTNDLLDGTGQNILTPQIPYISQTLGKQLASDAATEWATRGGFYRLSYNYDGKYLVESNGRYDGTSRFPKASRFQFYPSFSGGWIVTKEKFAKSITPVVTFLKLRATYGNLGNQNVSNYIYIPSYSTNPLENQLFNGILGVGIAPPGLVSPTLTWEKASTINYGADVTLWNRLDISFEKYTRKTSDILVAGDKFPAVLGTSAPTKNSGVLQTNGWELSAKWRDQLKNGFSYDITLSLSDYLSKVVTFNGNPNKLLSALYAGQTMGEIWGYQTVGTFQTTESIAKSPNQKLLYSGIWYPGDIQYQNINNDTIISPGSSTLADPGDRKVIGNSTPRYQFGLNMNASYKGFDINIFFQGVGKRDVWISDQLFWGLEASSGATGTWEVYNNSWTTTNTNALYPAYRTQTANILPQTKYLQNGAYLRLKNVTIGYTLPKNLVKIAGIDHVRAFFSTYNIWTLSKLPGIYDPETLTSTYPMIRSVAFGFQVSL